MDAKSLLERASDYAFSELDRAGGDLAKLPLQLQTVVIVFTAQGIIDNGGFQYLFASDFPNDPAYTLFSDAYRKIGASNAADCIEKAVALFPFPQPHLSRERRKAFLDSLPKGSEFFQLGERISVDNHVWEALEHYVSDNRASFPIE